MRHLYSCPLRWADLDQLGHVNNVVYVDYLQEARVDMLREHAPGTRDQTPGDRSPDDLVEGVVVVRHEVDFLAPLSFRLEPVSIECWVTQVRAASFTMAYEIYDETPAGRRVYARATTLLTPYVFATERPRRLTAPEKERLGEFLDPGAPAQRPAFGPEQHTETGRYRVHVRFSDVDVYGHVNNVKYFEYFQEARLAYVTGLTGDEPGRLSVPLVVARTDVDYRVPILFRAAPYDAWTWVSRVGRSSYELQSEIRDGDTVLSRCRAVCVTFDPATQRAVPTPEAYRDRLLAELPSSTAGGRAD